MTNDSGLVVRVGDRVVDGSVAGRLNALGERLRTAVEERDSLPGSSKSPMNK